MRPGAFVLGEAQVDRIMILVPKGLIRQVLAFAGLHVGVLMMAWLLAIASLPGIDDSGGTPSMLGRVAEVLLGVLVMPVLAVLMIRDGESGHSDGLEWTLLILNSLVWGVALACLRAWWLRRKQA